MKLQMVYIFMEQLVTLSSLTLMWLCNHHKHMKRLRSKYILSLIIEQSSNQIRFSFDLWTLNLLIFLSEKPICCPSFRIIYGSIQQSITPALVGQRIAEHECH